MGQDIRYTGPGVNGGVGLILGTGNPSPQVFAPKYGAGAFASPADKGPNYPVMIRNFAEFTRRYGGVRSDSELAVQVSNYLRAKGKAGGKLIILRVADGTERTPWIHLYDRNVDLSHADQYGATQLASPVCRILASSGNRVDGQQLRYGNSVADIQAAISGATLTTVSTAFIKGDLLGATLHVEGETKTWPVSGNTAAGVITVTGTLASIVSTGAKKWWVVRKNVDSDGNVQTLSARITDGDKLPSTRFGLRFETDRRVIPQRKKIKDANLGTTDNYLALVNKAIANKTLIEATAVNLFAGDPNDALQRPANFAELIKPGTAPTNVVQFQMRRWQKTGSSSIYVNAFTQGTEIVPHKYVLTYASGTTYSVAAYYYDTDKDGAAQVIAEGLPIATVDAAYSAPHPFLSGFTPKGTPSSGDTITIYVNALPSDLREQRARFFADAASANPGAGNIVISNTWDTVTLGSNVDVSSDVTVAGRPTATGTVADPGTWDTLGLTMKYQVKNLAGTTILAEKTLTLTGANPQSAAALASELNGLEGTGTDDVTWEAYTDGGSTYLRGTYDKAANQIFGPSHYIEITTGTLNTVVGFTNGTKFYGATPLVARLEFSSEARGGRDGMANSLTSQYLDALDVATSPFNDFGLGEHGKVRLDCPGVYTASVQQAVFDLCASLDWDCFGKADPAIINFQDAKADVDSRVTFNGNADFVFPIWGIIDDPIGNGAERTIDMSGALMGVEALQAHENGGYQMTASGQIAEFSVVKRLITDVAGREHPTRLPNAAMEEAGAIELRHIGAGRMMMYGNKRPGPSGLFYKHDRQCRLHIANMFKPAFGWIDFRPIDQDLYSDMEAHAKKLLQPLADPIKGTPWFVGKKFTINTGPAINTDATRAGGEAIMEVAFLIPELLEHPTIIIGTPAILHLSQNKNVTFN